MSDVEVTAIATRPLSNRRIVARALGGILRPYDADGVEPRLVADFANNFYFANNYQVPLSTAFTHARSSSATMVDSTGTLITVGSDVPRIGHHVYNGSAWVNEGYLHESEARTNLVTYSEDFTDASWTKSNTGTLAVDAAGPDGETSAVTFVDSGAGGTGNVYLSYSHTVSTSTTYTASIFAKADQLNYLVIYIINFTTPANGGYIFNLTNGTTSVLVSAAGIEPNVEDMGNGWYRCSVTFTTDVGDTNGLVRFYPAEGTASSTVDLDGTSSILIYGAQFEEGSTPSSYIPTSGSTVTRSADTMTASNLPWPAPTALSAKNKLVNEFGWVITDGGGV